MSSHLLNLFFSPVSSLPHLLHPCSFLPEFCLSFLPSAATSSLLFRSATSNCDIPCISSIVVACNFLPNVLSSTSTGVGKNHCDFKYPTSATTCMWQSWLIAPSLSPSNGSHVTNLRCDIASSSVSSLKCQFALPINFYIYIYTFSSLVCMPVWLGSLLVQTLKEFLPCWPMKSH